MGNCLSTLGDARKVASKLESDISSDISQPTTSLSTEPAPVSGLPLLRRAEGHYLYLESGQKLIDGCGGAGVACIGHGRSDVARAISTQAKNFSYASWAHFENKPSRELSDWLIRSTGGEMNKVYVMSSGSEAVEGALKLAREYFMWVGQPQRVNFISRDESYHGTTIGALSVSGHVARRAPFQPLLPQNRHRIMSSNTYRRRPPGVTDVDFVAAQIAELAGRFADIGGHTVAAVIMEPVVGAAAGCVPSLSGYLKAVKELCEQHGALLILDEVMCGMGRTGTLHAWQQEGVVPDLQTIGKGLSGGYQPASALLVGRKIFDVMLAENKTFTHGHTYGNHPVVSAAALKVQKIIEKENLLVNVREQGRRLENLLKGKLRNHPNVGDIRGRGLFWAVEFVRDKATTEPFDPELQIAARVHKRAQQPPHSVLVYHGQGCAGSGRGDHIMIMPAYNASSTVIKRIVEGVVSAVEAVFQELAFDRQR